MAVHRVAALNVIVILSEAKDLIRKRFLTVKVRNDNLDDRF